MRNIMPEVISFFDRRIFQKQSGIEFGQVICNLNSRPANNVPQVNSGWRRGQALLKYFV